MSDKSDSLLPFVLGAAVGGLCGVLFAPQKGTETRRRIRDGAQDIKEKGEEYVSEAEERVRKEASAAVENIRDRSEKFREDTQHHLDAVKQAAAEAKKAYQTQLNSAHEKKS